MTYAIARNVVPDHNAALMARGGSFVRTRKALKWSQGELAKRAGVHISTVVRVEKGRNVESVTLDKISDALAAGAAVGIDRPFVPFEVRPEPGQGITSGAEQQQTSSTTIETVELYTGDAARDFAVVPRLAGRIAAGHPLVIDDHDVDDYLALPRALITQLSISKPYFVRVGRDQRSMFPTIHPGATVLLDCSDAKRERPTNGRIYAVNVDGGSTLKRVVVSGGVVFLSSDNIDKTEYPMREITSDDDHTELPSIIVGEAVLTMNVLV